MEKTVDIYELIDMDIPPAAAHHARMRVRLRNLERRRDRHWRMNDGAGEAVASDPNARDPDAWYGYEWDEGG